MLRASLTKSVENLQPSVDMAEVEEVDSGSSDDETVKRLPFLKKLTNETSDYLISNTKIVFI